MSGFLIFYGLCAFITLIWALNSDETHGPDKLILSFLVALLWPILVLMRWSNRNK